MSVRQRTVVGPLLAQRGRCTRVVGHRESVERRPSWLSLGNYSTLQQCHGEHELRRREVTFNILLQICRAGRNRGAQVIWSGIVGERWWLLGDFVASGSCKR